MSDDETDLPDDVAAALRHADAWPLEGKPGDRTIHKLATLLRRESLAAAYWEKQAKAERES